MDFQDYFPLWPKLNKSQQERIRASLFYREVKKALSFMTVLLTAPVCSSSEMDSSGLTSCLKKGGT